MLLTNHALTGALIGATLQEPLLIVPIAFGSHFVMDALPHFGFRGMNFQGGAGRVIGYLDCAGALGVWLAVISFWPDQFWPLSLGIFFASLPDLLYLSEIFFGRVMLPPLRRFHSNIQWSETPPGLLVDLVWGVIVALILRNRS